MPTTARRLRTLLTCLALIAFTALFPGRLNAWADEAAGSETLAETATNVAAGSAEAAAADAQPEAQPHPGAGHVYLVVIPSLTWNDISNEKMPALQEIVAYNGVANVVTEQKVDIVSLVDNPRFHYMRINTGTLGDMDAYIAKLYNNLGPHDSLIVTSSPSLAKIASYKSEGYGLLVMANGDDGMLTSLTVRRSGLVTSGNVGDAINALLNDRQRNPANLSVFPFTEPYGALKRTTELSRMNSVATSIEASESGFISMFVVLQGITLVISAALLSLDIRIRPRFLAHMLPLTRILWIVVLSIPLATFIMHLQLPSFTTPEITYDFFLFVVMELSFACIVIALVFRWSLSLLFLLALTVLTLIADQLIGGPMTATGYLSYSPLEVTRYYGIGNEGAALAFGAWVMFSGLLLNRIQGSSAGRHFRRWTFPLASVFILTVIAAPWWGTNFGSLIWGTVGIAVAWALFNNIRLNWKHLTGFVTAAAALTFAVLLIDSSLNGESHLGVSLSALEDGWHLVILRIFGDMIRLSWNTIVFSPALSVVFVIIVAFLIFLRWRKPGLYQTFWEENRPFTAAFTALMAAGLLMLMVEDSGILMPALVLLYETAGLLWLVCDRHSWHIRSITWLSMNREFSQAPQREVREAIDAREA
ncbi:hypothetical protein HLV35_06065 [Eggerthellaceae bacterium zg-997]|nr:hypothetical protein [Eggerthellaceae bacterium zg-997]